MSNVTLTFKHSEIEGLAVRLSDISVAFEAVQLENERLMGVNDSLVEALRAHQAAYELGQVRGHEGETREELASRLVAEIAATKNAYDKARTALSKAVGEAQ